MSLNKHMSNLDARKHLHIKGVKTQLVNIQRHLLTDDILQMKLALC